MEYCVLCYHPYLVSMLFADLLFYTSSFDAWSNCSEIASLLLRDKRWKKMMKQKTECDNAHPELQTPLSNLIVKMPGKWLCIILKFQSNCIACNGWNWSISTWELNLEVVCSLLTSYCNPHQHLSHAQTPPTRGESGSASTKSHHSMYHWKMNLIIVP